MGKFRDQNRHKWTKRPSQKPRGDKPKKWAAVWVLVALIAAGIIMSL